MEHPEYWLTFGSPWEIERDDIQYEIQYYGSVIEECDAYGNCKVWVQLLWQSSFRKSGWTRRR